MTNRISSFESFLCFSFASSPKACLTKYGCGLQAGMEKQRELSMVTNKNYEKPKYMNKTFIKLVVAFFISINCFAQTPGNSQPPVLVKIMDLSVLSVVKPVVSNSLQDSVSLQVMFKINNKALVSKAYYLFGTSADAGDILTTELTFVSQGNSVFLHNNGSQNEVVGYNASIVLKLTKQQSDNFKFLTVYVERPNGQISNKLYFKK